MRDMGLRGVAWVGAVCALVLCLLPRDAGAICPLPPCCHHGSEGSMVAQVEVTSVEVDGLGVALLQTPVYCEGGIECGAAQFPLEFSWAAGTPCEGACGGCAPFAVGDRAIFMVDRDSGCIQQTFMVDGVDVDCFLYSAPVEFVLEQALDPSCYVHTVEAGYWAACDDMEDCSDSTTGQGGGVVLALVVGLGLLQRKRR